MARQQQQSRLNRPKYSKATFCTFLQVGLAHSLEQMQREHAGLCIVALISDSTLAAKQQQQKKALKEK